MPAKVPANTRLTMAQAANALGVTAEFTLTLALSGARRPADQGGEVVEIDYAMDGNEVTFTKQGVDRFLKRCPAGELFTAAAAAERLGTHKARVAELVYTGIQTDDGRILRLPVWLVGNREYVARTDLAGFEGHFQSWNERKAARALKKRGRRPGKQTAEA